MEARRKNYKIIMKTAAIALVLGSTLALRKVNHQQLAQLKRGGRNQGGDASGYGSAPAGDCYGDFAGLEYLSADELAYLEEMLYNVDWSQIEYELENANWDEWDTYSFAQVKSSKKKGKKRNNNNNSGDSYGETDLGDSYGLGDLFDTYGLGDLFDTYGDWADFNIDDLYGDFEIDWEELGDIYGEFSFSDWGSWDCADHYGDEGSWDSWGSWGSWDEYGNHHDDGYGDWWGDIDTGYGDWSAYGDWSGDADWSAYGDWTDMGDYGSNTIDVYGDFTTTY